MDRRTFLHAATMATVPILLPVSHSAWAAMSSERSVEPATERKLIVIFLRGAVDGLNVVVPYADGNYYQLRSGIAVARPGQEAGALDLDGYFGLHPSLAPLLPLWQQRKLAFVHAAGSPDPTRSHFDAQDFMESGTPGRKSTQDGWMNRLLGALPGTIGTIAPTRAISIGPVMPRILSGPVAATNIASGAAAGKPTVLDRPLIGDAFARMYQGQDAMSLAYQEGQQARQEVMSSLAEEMQKADNGAPLPNGFPADARHIASLMRNNPRIQFAFAALGGWDTHANQGAGKGQLANRLAPLGQGLATLAQALGPKFDDTTIVVMSEFGRTARQNGNNGTDHGHGNVMWLLGGRVAGGKVHGEWPGLGDRQLHDGRDLAITTDFRSVLAHVAERHLRLPDAKLEQVFPAMPAAGKSPNLIT